MFDRVPKMSTLKAIDELSGNQQGQKFDSGLRVIFGGVDKFARMGGRIAEMQNLVIVSTHF